MGHGEAAIGIGDTLYIRLTCIQSFIGENISWEKFVHAYHFFAYTGFYETTGITLFYMSKKIYMIMLPL